ncbi:hypothetical protein N9W89_12470 [Hellea sp.]|nr:hypothetical protein [Hellea sp.]
MVSHAKTLAISLGLLVSLAACTTVSPPSGNVLKPNTAWVYSSKGWADEAKTVYVSAADYVTEKHVEYLPESWAVIMDLDETVLNNVIYQVEREQRGEAYSAESWYEWTQKENATLVPGAREFIKTVNDLGGHVAFVTNRSDKEQLATENNLSKLNLKRNTDFRILLTRASPKGERDKSDRFEIVPELLEVQGYPNVKTIAFIGDNIGDQPNTIGDYRFFCIDQGAMYGEPCAKVPGPGE